MSQSSDKNKFNDLIRGSPGFKITQTELRGITLNQLRDIRAFIEANCVKDEWKSWKNEPLRPEFVTLYDANKYIIKASTASSKCSYVELVATSAQKPRWFVSHWWGEPVLDFVACIEMHAYDRHLDADEDPYWVCAYANNQWDALNEVGDDPLQSSFARAMDLSVGTVSILDRESVTYTRIWCGFEIFITLSVLQKKRIDGDLPPYLYDVYTRTTESDGETKVAVGLTDGVPFMDRHEMRDGKPFELLEALWTEYRRRREANFPLASTHNALGVSVEEAEASYPEDKNRILNCIRGKSDDLTAEPPTTDPSYDVVNALLRGKFASRGYLRAYKSGEDMTPYRTLLLEAPILSLEFATVEIRNFETEAPHLALSLPPTLRRLDYNIDAKNFTSSDQFALGLERLVELRYLKLSCEQYYHLSEAESLWTAISAYADMRTLWLGFKFCDELESVDGLGVAIGNLTKLTSLTVGFEGCPRVGSVGSLAEGLEGKEKITTLALDFRFCALDVESTVRLCRVVAKLQVENLDLKLFGNRDLPYAIGDNFESVEDLRAALDELDGGKKGGTEDEKCFGCVIS